MIIWFFSTTKLIKADLRKYIGSNKQCHFLGHKYSKHLELRSNPVASGLPSGCAYSPMWMHWSRLVEIALAFLVTADGGLSLISAHICNTETQFMLERVEKLFVCFVWFSGGKGGVGN